MPHHYVSTTLNFSHCPSATREDHFTSSLVTHVREHSIEIVDLSSEWGELCVITDVGWDGQCDEIRWTGVRM